MVLYFTSGRFDSIEYSPAELVDLLAGLEDDLISPDSVVPLGEKLMSIWLFMKDISEFVKGPTGEADCVADMIRGLLNGENDGRAVLVSNGKEIQPQEQYVRKISSNLLVPMIDYFAGNEYEGRIEEIRRIVLNFDSFRDQYGERGVNLEEVSNTRAIEIFMLIVHTLLQVAYVVLGGCEAFKGVVSPELHALLNPDIDIVGSIQNFQQGQVEG